MRLPRKRVAQVDQRLRAFVRDADPPLAFVPNVSEFGPSVGFRPNFEQRVAHVAGNVFLATIATVGKTHVAVFALVRLTFLRDDRWRVEWMLYADHGAKRRQVAQSNECIGMRLGSVVVEQNATVVLKIAVPTAIDAVPFAVCPVNDDIRTSAHCDSPCVVRLSILLL